MSDAPFVESKIVGFFEPDFVADGPVLMTLEEGARGMLDREEIPPTRIYDARHLQASAAGPTSLDEAGFFEEHGFVLLPHESAVEDWDADPLQPESDLTRVYLAEIETLIRRRLLPGRAIDLWQAPPMRRGPGTPNPLYAGGVHQDFGLTPDDYQETIEAFTGAEVGQAWRNRYERADVAGFLAIDFWRTAGMRGPLQHMPLSLCHPGSVRVEDVVPIGLLDFTPSGRPTNQSGLRYDPNQRFYYYSEMSPNEVLVFKQFQFFKDDPAPEFAACFHTAFELPNTPVDAEERQSSEQRVLIFLLRN